MVGAWVVVGEQGCSYHSWLAWVLISGCFAQPLRRVWYDISINEHKPSMDANAGLTNSRQNVSDAVMDTVVVVERSMGKNDINPV